MGEKWIYDGRDTKCPFYRKHTNMKISCEGIESRTALHLVFEKKEDLKTYIKKHCNRYSYISCPIAKTLEGKYEDES